MSSEPGSGLRWEETRLFEPLSLILEDYLLPADRTVVLEKLRDVLLADQRTPDLQGVHTATRNCTRCPTATARADLPRWNLDDPDVLIVLETLQVPDVSLARLVESMKSAGFTSRRIAVTGLTRCPGVGVEGIENCFGYLAAEITRLRPKLIVAAGAAPTQRLLGEGTKAGDARGKIWWVGPWAILATHSPGFCLRRESAAKELDEDLVSAWRFVYAHDKI